jgi:hypothetical protein
MVKPLSCIPHAIIIVRNPQQLFLLSISDLKFDSLWDLDRIIPTELCQTIKI